ncbi:MAG: hypothetical protein EXR31_05575 [Betaproteobacteria bacterium]|nr:hypothetical protein [Betaproteobacteria bacterium]
MRRAALAAATLAALATSSTALALGDADKGAKLHDSCLQCHGTNVYVPPKSKVKTFKQLQAETAKWADYYNPKFSKLEIADLVAWLNREFYKLPEK